MYFILGSFFMEKQIEKTICKSKINMYIQVYLAFNFVCVLMYFIEINGVIYFSDILMIFSFFCLVTFDLCSPSHKCSFCDKNLVFFGIN